MRLLKHLNEAFSGTSIIELAQLLYDKSQPYMRDMAKTKLAANMFSGRTSTQDVFVKQLRSDRYPTDTPYQISDDFDFQFKRKFGWGARSNAIFVVGNDAEAEDYGTPYMIFPVGKYKFLWNKKISDLWGKIDSMGIFSGAMRDNFEPDDGEIDDFMMDNDITDDFDDEVQQYIRDTEKSNEKDYKDYVKELVSRYTNKDLPAAIRSGNEIMLNSKEYVAIHNKYYQVLSSFIKFHNWKKRPTVDDMSNWAQKNKVPNKDGYLWRKR